MVWACVERVQAGAVFFVFFFHALDDRAGTTRPAEGARGGNPAHRQPPPRNHDGRAYRPPPDGRRGATPGKRRWGHARRAPRRTNVAGARSRIIPSPPPASHAGSHPLPPQRLALGAAAADGNGSPLPPLPPRPPPGCCGRSAAAPRSLGRRWASRGTAGGCCGRWGLPLAPSLADAALLGQVGAGPPDTPQSELLGCRGWWGRPFPLTRPPLGCSGPRRPPGTPPEPLFLLLDLAPLLQLLGGAPHDQTLPALRLPHWPQPLCRRQASPLFRATRRGRAGPAGLAAAATQPTSRRALSSPHRRRCRRHGHRRCYPRRRHLCRRGRLRGDCAAAGTRSRGPATSAAAAQWRPPGPWGEGMVRGVAAAGGTPLRTTGGESPLRRPPPPAPAPRRWPPIVPSP